MAVGGASLLRHNHGRSWIEPNANKNRLLYVTDNTNGVVEIYNYPSVSQAGELTGLTGPQGECVDKNNNVYIANTGTSEIWWYSHGTTNPTKLADPAGYPVGCSIDPTTGNLAVTNVYDPKLHQGNISIYTPPFNNGNTPATSSSDPSIYGYYSLAYDSAGHLFVDGQNSSALFRFAEYSGGSWTDLSVDGAMINYPGGVQFDGRNVTVGDQGTYNVKPTIYRTRISGSTATVVGSTTLEGASNVVQYFLKKGMKGVVAPDSSLRSANTFGYPSGLLSPRKQIQLGSYATPIGAAVSLGPGN